MACYAIVALVCSLLVNINNGYALALPENSTADWRIKGFNVAKALQTSFSYFLSFRNNPEEHSASTRRLLGSTASSVIPQQQPDCEIDLTYNILTIDNSYFTSALTIINNRELSSNWQLVYRYLDTQLIRLTNATGAIVLSKGSQSGAPIRLVDNFEYGDGIPPTGGNYTFTTTASFITSPAVGNESLLLQAVNVNGLQCAQSSPSQSDNRLEQHNCTNALSLLSMLGNTSSSVRSVENSCSASWCCGYQLQSITVPLPSLEGRYLTQEQQNNDSSVVELPPSIVEPVLPPPQLSPGDSFLDFNMSRYPLLPPPDDIPIDNTTTDNRNSILGREGKANNIGVIAGVVSAAVVVLFISLAMIAKHNRNNNRANKVRFVEKSDNKTMSGSDNRTVIVKHNHPLKPASTSIMHGLPFPPSHKNVLTMQQITFATPDKNNQQPSPSTPTKLPKIQPDDYSLPQEVELIEQIGFGAFGTVYRGQWDGKAVAVKVLQTACTSDSKELQTFRQEVNILSKVRHPHIISFLAACTVPPDICIIEELAEGSLATKLHGPRGARHNSALPLPELLQLAIDIAEAMSFLHPRIVHRDLKAQNILLDAKGRAKVCDFGIAKFKDRTFVSTVNGQAGTPSYMAPELFDGGQASEKVDVFSYGVLLWEMLTGKVPWGEVVSPMQIIYYVGVLHQRLPLPNSCHPVLKVLIEKCWSDVPSVRPHFKDILVELKGLQADATLVNGTQCNNETHQEPGAIEENDLTNNFAKTPPNTEINSK